MGKLGEAKNLGGIGSILELVPGVWLVGLVLTLVAVKYLSEEFNERKIFDNMLYAITAALIGGAVAIVIFFTFVFGGFLLGGPTVGAPFSWAAFASGAETFSVLFAVTWLVLIIASIYIRRAYNEIANHLNIQNFRTAGTLYFYGALTLIVFGLGFILILVAVVFQIIAFFAIKETSQQTGGTQSPMVITGTKYCANCGTQIATSAAFCPNCGQKQP